MRWMVAPSWHWPSRCAVCRAWPSQPVCSTCLSRFLQPCPRCASCALPLPSTGLERCGVCLRHPPALDRCVVAVSYAYPWNDRVTDLKFRHQLGWARWMATLMRDAVGARALIESADCVLPIPLAPERLRQRGFNQAQALAQCLAPGRCATQVLLRLHATQAQSALHRSERLDNVAHAFDIDPLRVASVQGRRVLLIDDVITTGATVSAAARVLRRFGASDVSALAFARTDGDAAA